MKKVIWSKNFNPVLWQLPKNSKLKLSFRYLKASVLLFPFFCILGDRSRADIIKAWNHCPLKDRWIKISKWVIKCMSKNLFRDMFILFYWKHPCFEDPNLPTLSRVHWGHGCSGTSQGRSDQWPWGSYSRHPGGAGCQQACGQSSLSQADCPVGSDEQR